MSTQPPPIEYASPGAATPRKPSFIRGVIGWMIFVGIAIAFFMLMRQGRAAGGPMVSFGQFVTDLQSGNVRSIDVMSDELEYTVYAPTRTSPNRTSINATNSRVRIAPQMGNDFHFIQWLTEARANNSAPDIHFKNNSNFVVNLLLPLIPWLLIFGFLYFFVFRLLRRQQANPRPAPVVIVNPEALRQ